MHDHDTIDAIAKAIGAGMNGRSPNSTDRDFAERFLHAQRAFAKIQEQQSSTLGTIDTSRSTPSANRHVTDAKGGSAKHQ